MKKMGLSLASTIVATLLISSSVGAESNGEEKTIDKELESGITIEFFGDGRVAPIEDTSNLTEENLNEILLEIGYDQDYINSLGANQKESMVNTGGKLADTSEIEILEQYNSLDGNVYDVTEETEDEVRKIQENDLKQMGVSEDEFSSYDLAGEDENEVGLFCTPVSGWAERCTTNSWQGDLMAVYIGENSQELIYEIGIAYNWNDTTNVNFRDTIGVHWGANAQPIAGTQHFSQNTRYPNGNIYENSFTPSPSGSTFGASAKFFLAPPNENISGQGGMLSQEVTIDKMYLGQNQAIEGMYNHPWVPGVIEVAFSRGGLSVGSSILPGSTYQWQANYRVNSPL